MDTGCQLDANAIRNDVRLLARLANGGTGKLVATGFGEDPCGSAPLTPKVIHGSPADPDTFADAMVSLGSERHRNLYVSLALFKADLNDGLKGGEADVVSVLGVVAEFDAKNDPHAGDWATRLPMPPTMVLETSSLPAPSVQCRYLFTRPVAPEQAKRIAVMLTEATGADPVCKDICHVWRPAGDRNDPNRRKVQAGRPLEPQAVKVVVPFADDRLIEPDELERTLSAIAPRVKPKATGTAPAEPTDIRTDAPRLNHVDELGPKVTDSVKVYVVNGEDPKSPGHFPSRSEMLFWVVCELVRADVPREVIYSVITDPKFKVSDSVLEKKGGAERYALRQIRRAEDDAIDPMLREMNDRHAVIGSLGGKCRVMEEVEDETMGRTRVEFSTFPDIRNRYLNKEVVIGSKKGVDQTMPAGEWWLRHPKRRQYASIVYAPGRTVAGSYNLWQSFGVMPKPGSWVRMANHLRDNVCAGNADHYRYFLGWFANMVQKPGEPGHTAIVMRGGQGTGKSIVGHNARRIMGRHGISISNPTHLVGNFNSHLRDCSFVFADEAFFAGDPRHARILKTLVTEPVLMIEQKGVDASPSPNCVHLLMASNEKWVVPAESDDRRYFVLDVSNARANDHAYFAAIQEEMDNGGLEAMLHDLLAMDLSGFNVRAKPDTAALRDQKLRSLPPEDEWLLSLLEDGALPASAVPVGKASVAYSNDRDTYPTTSFGIYTVARRSVPRLRDWSDKRLGATLASWGCTRWRTNQARGWTLPSLGELRAAWDAKFGPHEWPEGSGPDWAAPVNDAWSDSDTSTQGEVTRERPF